MRRHIPLSEAEAVDRANAFEAGFAKAAQDAGLTDEQYQRAREAGISLLQKHASVSIEMEKRMRAAQADPAGTAAFRAAMARAPKGNIAAPKRDSWLTRSIIEADDWSDSVPAYAGAYSLSRNTLPGLAPRSKRDELAGILTAGLASAVNPVEALGPTAIQTGLRLIRNHNRNKAQDAVPSSSRADGGKRMLPADSYRQAWGTAPAILDRATRLADSGVPPLSRLPMALEGRYIGDHNLRDAANAGAIVAGFAVDPAASIPAGLYYGLRRMRPNPFSPEARKEARRNVQLEKLFGKPSVK